MLKKNKVILIGVVVIVILALSVVAFIYFSGGLPEYLLKKGKSEQEKTLEFSPLEIEEESSDNLGAGLYEKIKNPGSQVPRINPFELETNLFEVVKINPFE